MRMESTVYRINVILSNVVPDQRERTWDGGRCDREQSRHPRPIECCDSLDQSLGTVGGCTYAVCYGRRYCTYILSKYTGAAKEGRMGHPSALPPVICGS